MNKELSIGYIKKLVYEKVSVNMLMLSIKNWFDNMPEGQLKNYKELEHHYNMILLQNSFDQELFQKLADCAKKYDNKLE